MSLNLMHMYVCGDGPQFAFEPTCQPPYPGRARAAGGGFRTSALHVEIAKATRLAEGGCISELMLDQTVLSFTCREPGVFKSPPPICTISYGQSRHPRRPRLGHPLLLVGGICPTIPPSESPHHSRTPRKLTNKPPFSSPPARLLKPDDENFLLLPSLRCRGVNSPSRILYLEV